MKSFKSYLKLKINEKFSVAGPVGGNINYSNSRRPYQLANANVNTSPDVYDQASRAMVNDKDNELRDLLKAAAAAKDAQVTKSAPTEVFGMHMQQPGEQSASEALGTAIYGDKDSIERDASIEADEFQRELESSGRGQAIRDATAEGAKITAAFDAGHQAGGGSEEDLDAIRKGKGDQGDQRDQRQKDADDRWAPKYGSSTDNGFASSGNKRRNSGNVSIPGVEEGGNISLSGRVPPMYPKQPGVTIFFNPTKSELVSASKNSNSGNNETQNQSITLDGPELENGNFASGTYNLNMNQTQKARNSDGTIINQGQEQETRLQGSAGEGDQYYDAGSVDFIGSQRQVNGVNVAQDSAINVDNPRPHPQGDENPLLNTMADRRRGHMTVNLSKTQTDNSNADNNVNPSAAPSAAELVQGSQNAAPTATPTATPTNTSRLSDLEQKSKNTRLPSEGATTQNRRDHIDAIRAVENEKRRLRNETSGVKPKY